MIYTKVLRPCEGPVFVVQEVEKTGASIASNISSDVKYDGKIKIIGNKAPKYSESTIRLACDMVMENETIKDFMKILRKAAHSDDKTFQFNMISKTAGECKSIVDIAFRMYGVLHELNWKYETKVLSGKVNELPKAIRFLCGEYLEIAAYKIACSAVEQFAVNRGVSWAVYPNVIVTNGFVTNEFDLLIEITDTEETVHSFIIEMKSGNAFGIDLGKMRSIGERYGVIPDRMMLVTSSCSAEICCQMEDFIDFYIASSENFTTKLIEMLSKNLGGK